MVHDFTLGRFSKPFFFLLGSMYPYNFSDEFLFTNLLLCLHIALISLRVHRTYQMCTQVLMCLKRAYFTSYQEDRNCSISRSLCVFLMTVIEAIELDSLHSFYHCIHL